MAHTYRRRHLTQWEDFILSDWVVHASQSDSRWLQRIRLDPKSIEGRRKLARFHADRPFHPGPSRRFRKAYHASERQACHQALYRWVHRDDHDFLAPPPHLHRAAWDWF
jgi:hypothetical protein